MEFYFPDILFFLPALFIPVIIHLFNFRRYKKIYFSNVGSLSEFAKEHRSQNQIREWLLMLIRCLILLFLILAFAGVHFGNSANRGLRPSESRILEVYIDNSPSMNLSGNHGNLLEEARAKTIDLIQSGSINTSFNKFALLSNDFNGLDFQILDKDEFTNRILTLKTSVSHKTITQILNRFKEINLSIGKGQKSVFLLSDFQLNTFNHYSPAAFLRALHDFDSSQNSISSTIQFEPKPQTNIYVDSVWNLAPIQKLGEENSLIVRVKRSNSSQNAPTTDLSVPFKVHFNQETKGLGLIHFKNSDEMLDTIPYLIGSTGIQEVRVDIEDQPILFDNTFFASWTIPSSLEIYHIHGPKTDKFLQAVFDTDPYFKFTQVGQDEVDYNTLSGQNLVFLEGLTNPGSGLIGELSKVLQRGGTLVYIPAVEDSLNQESWMRSQGNFLNHLNGESPRAWILGDQKFGIIGKNNPFLEGVFDKIPRNMDLPRVNRYLQFETRFRISKRVWFTLEGMEPLLQQFYKNKGSLYTFSIPFSESYSNLVRHPLFLPIIYKIVFRSQYPYPLYYTLGKDHYFQTKSRDNEERSKAIWEGDSIRIIPKWLTENESKLDLGTDLQKPGFYHLTINNKAEQSFALNFDRSESILKYLPQAEIESYNERMNNLSFTSGLIGIKGLKENQAAFSLQLWKVCLILAMLLLATEQALIRKKSQAEKT